MKRCLNSLFLLLGNNEKISYASEDLFGFFDDSSPLSCQYKQEDIDLLFSYFKYGFDPSVLAEPARYLLELSANTFDIFLHAWMSELPVETQMLSFGRRVIAAAQTCSSLGSPGSPGSLGSLRHVTEKILSDRTDEDTRTVLAAAYKVQHEIHRMMGLLRFSPDKDGVFIARCEPDHFILPAFGEYFKTRFGESAWAIIDEKRGFCLYHMLNEDFKLSRKDEISCFSKEVDEWEDLWKHYHKTINNESRNNPDLQRQLMPKRYWKYLPEI
jgi:hypothetical protein